MPTIFEINSQSLILHDFDSERPLEELYGFTYSVVSNQYVDDQQDCFEI